MPRVAFLYIRKGSPTPSTFQRREVSQGSDCTLPSSPLLTFLSPSRPRSRIPPRWDPNCNPRDGSRSLWSSLPSSLRFILSTPRQPMSTGSSRSDIDLTRFATSFHNACVQKQKFGNRMSEPRRWYIISLEDLPLVFRVICPLQVECFPVSNCFWPWS